jgi:hypothetical protein
MAGMRSKPPLSVRWRTEPLRCQDGTGRSFLRHRRLDSEHQAIFIAGYDITEQESRDIASLLRICEGPKRADAAI